MQLGVGVKNEKAKKYADEVLKQLLFFTVCYCIEYKVEHDRKKLDSLQNVTSDNSQNLADLEFDDLFAQSPSESTAPTEKSYSELFEDKYLPYENTLFNYYPSIAEFIHSGVLEEEALNAELIDLVDTLTRKEATRESQLVLKLNHLYTIEDSDLQQMIEEVLSNVEQGKYQLTTYPNIFIALLRIEHEGLHNFKVTPNIVDTFKKGIDIGKNISKYFVNFEFHLPRFEKPNATYKIISDHAITANDSIKTSENKKYVDQIMKAMAENSSNEIFSLISNSSYQFQPLFNLMDVDLFFKYTLGLKNEGRGLLLDGLELRYSYGNASQCSKTELTFFVHYLEMINVQLTKDASPSIGNKILSYLARSIERIIQLPD